MKRISVLLLAGALLFTNQLHAERKHRNLKAVCGRVLDAGNASSTIYKQSAPLRSGGVGTPLIGYRKEPGNNWYGVTPAPSTAQNIAQPRFYHNS